MEINIVLTPDAFLQNDCIVFDRPQTAHLVDRVPDIAALCVICTEEQLPRDLAVMDKTCAERAAFLLFDNSALDDGYSVWLFLCHGPWQPRSAIVRRRGLWASFSVDSQLNIMRRSNEIVFESKHGLRYAGVAQIAGDSLFAATQIIRGNSSCAIIVSKRPDISSEDEVKALFKAAFPVRREVAATQIDWLRLSICLCPLGDILGGIRGSWDEREVSFNLIMTSDNLRLFGRQ